MVNKSFQGGVHLPEQKELSSGSPLRWFQTEGDMVYPLSQHIGKPARPVVKKGDSVLVGSCLAEADGFVSAPVFCGCSGTVKAIEKRRVISGALADCIIVENDGAFTMAEGVGEARDLSEISNSEIPDIVQRAGIVGLGGAGFPTHVKLRPKDPDSIRFIIANGAECEPYLTCNDRLMREYGDGIAAGLSLVLRLFPNAQGVIGIEDNKPEAIAAMQKAVAGEPRMSVMPLQTKYPQGGEHSLIRAVAGIDYPVAKLPADVGCIVENVGTLYAIWRAAAFREPLFSHCFTLTGDAVKTPGNYFVREGTSLQEIIDASGGLKEGVTLKKALAGGPMMGFAISDLSAPVQKTTNGLTLLCEDGSELALKKQTACLRCGRCTTVCPTGLLPELMADAAAKGDYDRYEKKLYGLECVSCGSCSYICPAKRPLTETFKAVKAEILARRRAAQEGGAK
ncbi:MAG: electron transport complex subunit RsxC [Lachnospiraceae bacterium]|nr:electron transport complex subunit RsxC [Lachnospiraceae bacterium]